VLVFNAAVFKPGDVPGFEKYNNAFAFMVQLVHPNLKSFVVHVRPHPQGSLGKEGECYSLYLAQILQRAHVQILTFATDGDRGHPAYQQALFSNYREVLEDGLQSICDHCFQAQADPIGGAARTIWWVADPFHCFKCQRCRLQGNLSLCPGEPVLNAALLNASLNLRQCLTDLRGASKMNDVFAIILFSVEDLLTLAMEEHLNVYGAYDLMPFVLWYAVISIEDLGRDLRFTLLAVAFHIFRNWLRITVEQTRGKNRNPKLPGAKFFAEVIDLIRDLNLIIFLSHTVRDYNELSLNHMRTHSVENLFG
jgi:hypothetical protein